MPAEGAEALENLAFDLAREASELSGQLHPVVRLSVAELVRSMNCHYSNLIEGHNTHPRDIDRALAEDYSADPHKRDLQFEARAHIEVQRMIDARTDFPKPPASRAFIEWAHREFCSRLPESLLTIENPDTHERLAIVPGELRKCAVAVGRHVPPPADDLPAFMARFEQAYASERLTKPRQAIAAAAAHHRLLWIHPFLDGNGRVTRLMSHAMLLDLGVGSALWSISRGLARRSADYKRLLMAADEARKGDLDGRGALSQSALIDFCAFFLECCLDQVRYMRELLEPSELQRRIELYVRDEEDAERLPKRSFALLREALLSGELERGRVPRLIDVSERTARRVISALVDKKLLVSESHKAPLRLGFPIDVIERWFPRLYPVSA
ncbi:Fic family protein [Povalibacter uvarum]|uniref:Fic family protein n=1 Tax=Povalibacter uvarum TaxID=732238 RepID=A0A841HJD0_9GAMM|nr:Fic family protein [Povalibacter uvarum]MBB6092489.1 Fic family protein [Povalibacter uvarum]